MEKKSRFKKLLTTASAFAVIAGASTSAMAETRTDDGNAFTLGTVIGTSAHVVDANGNLVAFGNGNSFYFSNAVGGTTGDAITIASFDLNNLAAGPFVIAHDTTLGSVVDSGGANFLALTVNNARVLTLNGAAGVDANGGAIAANTYTGLGTITLNGATAKAVIGNGITLTKDIDGAAANNGAVEFQGGATVGDMGNAFSLSSIALKGAGAVNFNGANAVKATTVSIEHAGANAKLSQGLTGNISFTENGTVELAAQKTITGNITTSGDNTGKLLIKQNANTSTITGNIGTNGHAVKLVEIEGGAAHKLSLTNANGIHYAEQFKFNDAGSEIEVAAGGKLNGNAVANAAGNGKITFLGAGEFNGVLGGANALGKVESNGAAIVKIGAGDHKVTEFAVSNNAASGFQFADGANINGKISTAGANGVVEFKGNSTVSGVVGDGNDLTSIIISGGEGKIVALSEAAEATTTNITNGGTLQLKDAGILTTGGNAGVVNFTTEKGGVLKISSNLDHDFDVQMLAGKSVGSVVVDNTVVAGKVITLSKIGNSADATALNELNHNSAATVEFSAADSHVTAINIGVEGAVLDFTDAGDYKIGNINIKEDKFGTLKISEDIVFKAVGDNGISFGSADKKLKALQIADGKSLTLEDKINITANTVTSTAANGSIITSGDNIIDLGTQTNTLADLTVNGAAGKATVLKSVLTFAGNATIGDNATLEITKNFTAADISAANAGNGTVKFSNADEVEVTGTVGAGNTLKTIEFAGKKVKFATGANAMVHTGSEFKFSGDEATTVTFNETNNIGDAAKFTNSSKTDVTHTVVLTTPNAGGNAGTNFTGDLSSVNNGAKKINFQLANGVDAKLSGAVKADGANFTTSANNVGKLELDAANVVVNSVGATQAALEKVTFTESGTIKNGTVAKEVTVALGKTATLGGAITSTDGVKLDAAGSKVIFSDNAIINSKVVATIVGEGIVEYAGNATQNGKIGEGNKLNTINFSDIADKTVVLNTESINATNIFIKKGALSLARNLTITGDNVSANNSNIILGDKTLTFANANANGNNVITLNGDNKITLNLSSEKSALVGGHIVIDRNVLLNSDPNATIEILPQVKLAQVFADGTELEFTIIDAKNAAAGNNELKLENIKITDNNSHLVFTPQFVNKDLVAVARVDFAGNLRRNLGDRLDAIESQNVAVWLNAAAGTDAAKVRNLLYVITDGNGKEGFDKVSELIDRIIPNASVTDAVENAFALVGSGLGQRMDNLAGSSAAVEVSSLESGVAAGDDQHRYGVWASPFYNNTTQKARKGAAGYKSESYGATFGFDTRANNDMIVGTALTIASSDMKHKDFKSGDKTKINSYMFSIYGMQQITDNWFLHGVATYGTNEVKNTEKRVSGLTTYESVNGKYTANAFNAEATFGYNFATNDVTLTPMFGARFTRVNDGGYKETGSQTGQNLTVHTKASNKFEVVAGAKVSGYTFETNGVVLHPEVHGFINHDLIGKNGTPKVGQDGAPNGLAVKTNKPIRTTYNLGLSINSEYNMMEYGVGYDLDIANKRIGHQGTLKVRVNF